MNASMHGRAMTEFMVIIGFYGIKTNLTITRGCIMKKHFGDVKQKQNQL